MAQAVDAGFFRGVILRGSVGRRAFLEECKVGLAVGAGRRATGRHRLFRVPEVVAEARAKRVKVGADPASGPGRRSG